jgi:hypothetical protein
LVIPAPGKGSSQFEPKPEGGSAVCASCGCGIPEDNHGDDRNINWSAVVASAEANDISPAEAAQNIQKMAEQQG